MTSAQSKAIGSIDHVVIVVADLDRDAAIYRKLGFTVSPKGVHSAAMGSANHTIMLQRDYFELLTVTAPTERNLPWRQAIAAGGGVAGLALTTEDPATARSFWLGQGLTADEPARFSRPVRRQDGAELEARFETVTLDEVPEAGARVFVCSQPTREAVWLPELMSHQNSAVAVAGLTFACRDPEATAAQWRRIIPELGVERAAGGLVLRAGPRQIRLVSHAEAGAFGVALAEGETRAVGLDFTVASLDACRSALEAGEVPFTQEGALLRVPAANACNVALSFRQN